MALARAPHHSAQWVEAPSEGVEHEKNDGPRAQTTPLLGTRPAPLSVVAGSHGVWPGAPRQLGCVVPSVVPPALAALASETVDAAALSFLLAQSLAAQQQEEVEAKEQAAGFWSRFSGIGRRGPRSLVRPGPTLSRVEQLAVHWFLAGEEEEGKVEEEEKEEEAESTVCGCSGR